MGLRKRRPTKPKKIYSRLESRERDVKPMWEGGQSTDIAFFCPGSKITCLTILLALKMGVYSWVFGLLGCFTWLQWYFVIIFFFQVQRRDRNDK